MAVFMQQLWVTSAVCDAEVKSALSLSFSLRRTYTNRKIAVIASDKIAEHLKEALAVGFDMVFYLEEYLNTASMKLDDFAKLYALRTLRFFDKCVFVSPSMLAVKNCDDIFLTKGVDGMILMENDKDASIFLFRPSITHFKSILHGLGSNNDTGNGFGTYLADWSKNQFNKSESLDKKYNTILKPGTVLFRFEQDIGIVNLKELGDDVIMDSLRNVGFLGDLTSLLYRKILDEDVLPLIQDSTQPTHSLKTLPMGCNEPIAIVGMSCRYPGSNNLEEFWNLLFQGQDGTCKPPSFRWLREQSVVNPPEARNTNAGFLKVPVDEFDAKFFGISPKEAVFLDPQLRIMHELLWEGLEDACIDPHALRGTSGSVFFGSWLNNYSNILDRSANSEFYRVYMGNSIGAAAARLSFLLGLTGPSIATESGCSSAMVALHLACKSLQNSETDLALVGGVNLLLHPFDSDIMPMVLSPDGHCKTFSEDANGFARAEGCGVLVLKRLSTALKDGDNIWALIRGSAVSQEGISKSMGTPTVHCESLAMTKALNDAKICPGEVSYVEAHGTGTSVGDPMEIAAIAKAYNCSTRDQPLIIGSVKTNVGHTESCSGITGIMKVVLSMYHETIPAHLNFTKLNPAINLEAIPAIIPLERMEWKKCPGQPRIAGVSAFGITGTDAHAIIQEPPENSANKIMGLNIERPFHILKITAKTKEALDLLLNNYKETMETCKENLWDIAYSANTGRADFNHRIAIISKDRDDALKNIDKHNYIIGDTSTETTGKICFLFTGQGSQYPGMAKHLHESSPVFEMHFDYCENIMKKKYNISLKDVLWNEGVNSQDKINQTIYSQTSIFCVQYALLKLWESWGVKPDFALGHSLGEFAAAVCAGVLSVDDAIKLVAERSRLINALPQGKMLVIRAGFHEVQNLMKLFAGNDAKRFLDYAAINSNTQTVIAGDSDVVTEFSTFCSVNNVKCVELSASHAFHSRHMDAMLDKYRVISSTINDGGKHFTCQYLSGMTGNIISGDEVNAEYWIQHTREKVNFLDASKKVVELGCKVFIEIGPQPVLSALTMMNNDNDDLICLPSLKRKENSWETILTSLGKLYVNGSDIDWKGVDQFYIRKKLHDLPHYPFIGKKCWPDLIQMTGSPIHDLIGSAIPNASSTKIFQNGINLRSHEYIKDHAIGQHVIFPGAGYIEMCLAAGLATVENSMNSNLKATRPMKVENLLIKAPLALNEGITCQLQTVVEPLSNEANGDWSNFLIKIFHRQEVGYQTKWMEHASATFLPSPAAEDIMTLINMDEFKETIRKPSNNDEMITEVYEKLDAFGLKFGPLFRSLEKVWVNEDQNKILVKVKIPEGENGKDYILHPVLIDAMIQAVMILRVPSHEKVKLCVPFKIGSFIWLTNNLDDSGEIYIQVSGSFENGSDPTSASSLHTAYLANGNGTVLAVISGVELIETTAKTVEAVLEQQLSPMPDMWEENWRPKLGPLQHRHDMESISGKICFDDEFIENMRDKFNNVTPEKEETLKTIDRLVHLCYLRCFYELGWNPEIDLVFREDQFLTQLEIKPEFAKFLHYMLSVLEMDGVLRYDGLAEWKVVGVPPSLTKIKEQLGFEMANIKFKPVLLLMKLAEEYCEILKGKQSALTILFPDGSDNDRGWPSAAEFYEDYGKFLQIIDIFRSVESKKLTHLKANSSIEKNVLRVLEVGAGTGMSAKPFIEILEDFGLNFEYTFTDISAGFFPAAEKIFESHLKNMVFKKLNIEIDPIIQGFVPQYYDYILAGDVIHATKNIVDSLTNVKMLLRNGGQIVVCEQTKVSRFLTSIFGLLDGFWRFEDVDLRPSHCIMSIDVWQRVLQKTGFSNVKVFSTCKDSHSIILAQKNDNQSFMLSEDCTDNMENTKMHYWILFHQDGSPMSKYLRNRLSMVNNRNVITIRAGKEFNMSKSGNDWNATIDVDSQETFYKLFQFFETKEENIILEGILYCWSLDRMHTVQEKVLRPFFYTVQAVLNMKKLASLRIITLMNGIYPLEDNMSSNFYPSTIIGFIKSLQNERININCRCIDVGGKEDEHGAEQVFYEIWNSDKESQVCFQDNSRYIAKIQPVKPTLTDLELPKGSNRFQLILPKTNSISDLQFGPLEAFCLAEREIEVHVEATALNFKDVLNVLKPSDDFKSSNSVGFDFSGIVKRVGPGVSKYQIGQPVFGVNINGNALPSHIKVHENDVLLVPEGMTLWDACTLPAVVATSYYCLIEIAKVTAADTVLIHAASGGVGLSAISICKRIGCKLIVTAGSKRKQNYLRSLGIENVFHSRNHEYSEQILKATRGRGVDVVLNSLTSEGFKEATLKACGIGARFVEIGKLMIWKPEEVKSLRPDVVYTVVDLSSMEKSDFQRLFCAVSELIEKQYVSPIPYVRFDAVNIREALQYLQKAKHIGKVVCVMPEVIQRNGTTEVLTPMFNKNSTYLITGGLGGIGFVVCKWMIEKGAKHIILAGRSAPSEQMENSIREINELYRASVKAVQLDVGDFQQCKELIQEKIPKLMGTWKPLRGIMHAAGTLKDGLIEDQTWSTLSSTFDSKVNGTLNLHELTKNMNLEHFVLFSSIASLLGSPGQCNHSAGNKFEDIITHYRKSIGLPATSINWGQWGEAGVARKIVIPGIKPLTNLQGLRGLEYALKTHRAQIGCINIESYQMLSKIYPQITSVLDDQFFTSFGSAKGTGVTYHLKSDEFWQQYDSLQNIEEKTNLLREKLKFILAHVLKLDETEVIEDNSHFQNLGVDSLMFVEIKNALQTMFGNRVVVNANSIRELYTVVELAEALVQLIEGNDLKEIGTLNKEEPSNGEVSAV